MGCFCQLQWQLNVRKYLSSELTSLLISAQNIYLPHSMMDRPIGANKSINITDNAQCRCFDKLTAQENYFLLKNHYLKDAISPPKDKLHHNATNPQINTSNSKKSLKKEKPKLYNKSPEQPKRTYHHHPHHNEKQKTDRKEINFSPTQFSERSIEYRNSVKQFAVRQNQLQYRPPLLIKSVTTQILPAPFHFHPPMIPLAQYIPIKTIEVHHPKITQIHFTPRMYASADKPNIQSIPQTPRYKMQGVIPPNAKPRIQIKSQPLIPQKIQSQLPPNIPLRNPNLPQRKEMKQARVFSERTIKSKPCDYIVKDNKDIELTSKRPEQHISYYKQEPIKPIIKEQPSKPKFVYEKNKPYEPTSQSKHDSKNSYNDDATARSKITLKKLKNTVKPKLKKIDDVEEIKSMVDSDEMRSDDDKESVVLAKLNEYGSLVDPKKSAIENRPITFMSKVGYQSTTAQKSIVKGYDFINFK